MSEYKFEDYDYKETKEDILFEYFVYTLFMCLSMFILLNLVKFNEKPVEIVYIDSGKVVPVLDEVEVEFQPSTLSTSR
jgi:hypothetical protein